MAQFTTSNLVPTTHLVGRELSIASSFVKQYYTLLNKAPHYIHNFYSDNSTFIHGTIEVASEQYTEPIVGREKIKKKMDDLKLNDCRAKIKQIDCLATLAGGLVIQVIGELSNNGRPMRRFLQTFVLAPSPDESRAAQADGDSQHNSKPGFADNRSRNPNQQQQDTSPSQNQKFFALNSIFRYQDDVIEHEDDEEEDVHVTVQTTTVPAEMFKQETTTSSYHPQTNVAPNVMRIAGTGATAPASVASPAANSISDYPQNRRKQVEVKTVDEVERLGGEVEDKVKLTNSKPLLESGNEFNRDFKSSTSNGTATPAASSNLDKRSETTCEKATTENAKQTVAEHPQGGSLSTASSVTNQQPPASITLTSKSNEPKTWANMVRNAHALPASTQTSSPPSSNVTKATPTDQQTQQQQQQSLPQSQQQQQRQEQQQQQPQQASPNQATSQQQQSNQQPQNQQSAQNNTNRRRHMMRKPSNKVPGPGGRPMNKNRPPRPPIQQPLQHQQQSPSNQATGNNTKPFA